MVGLLLLAAACEPTATPLPIDLPATTAAPAAATRPPVQIALAENGLDLVADWSLLQAEASVSVLPAVSPALLTEGYDIIAQLGLVEGWQQSPVRPSVALVIGDLDPTLAAVLRHSIDTSALATALEIAGAVPENVPSVDVEQRRVELANLGYPDGFGLILGYSAVTGVDILSAQLRAVNIEARFTPLDGDQLREALMHRAVQAGVITWTTTDERQLWAEHFGEDNIVDLFSVPISFLAADDLPIIFTPGGWPSSRR